MLRVIWLCLCCGILFAGCNSGHSEESADAQWQWRSEGTFPVFSKLITLEESAAIGSPDVIALRDSSGKRLFRMVYAQGGADHMGRIGLAESYDGITWLRLAPSSSPSILQPAATGAWDSWFLDTPAILYRNGTWYLWYFGATSNATPGGAIGLATSADGINFHRAGIAPVLEKGLADDWDGLWIESPSVVYDSMQFVMYYTGVDKFWRPRVGRATSADGVVWTKDPANPVLSNGQIDAWDSFAAAVPCAFYRDGQWQLFYCSQSVQDSLEGRRVPRIGWAYSYDGRTFERYAANPILDNSLANSAPDGPYNPAILFDEETHRYYLWFETGLGFGLVSSAP